MPFHLTARVQGKLPLFVGMELAAARICRDVAERSDGELLAFAIMPNHVHLVYVQGARDLASFTQPLLTRIALLLRRRRGQYGHVFERRYRHSACSDVRHLRNAIAYAHLNPVRAGLCARAEHYEWTSHKAMCHADERGAATRCAWGSVNALRLFSPAPGADAGACRENYLRFLEWRVCMDRHIARGGSVDDPAAPAPVPLEGGDEHWRRCYRSGARRRPQRAALGAASPDLRDIARATLRDIAPDMSLDLLRSGARSRPLVAVRNAVIARALEAGHYGYRVARFLRVSETTVSRQSGHRRP